MKFLWKSMKTDFFWNFQLPLGANGPELCQALRRVALRIPRGAHRDDGPATELVSGNSAAEALELGGVEPFMVLMDNWLVVDLPLWKIWKSVGIIIPNRWKIKHVWNIWIIFPYIGNVIIPTDFHIFQKGRSTTNQIMNGEYNAGWGPLDSVQLPKKA